MQQALQTPFQLDQSTYHGGACIGVVMFSDVNYEPRELLKSAELAMYDAKSGGRDSLRFFNAQMQEQVRRRAELDGAIYRALENDEFSLGLQPQYDAQGRILGVESLVRWEHPVKGVIMPGEFIPAAEASGLILRLGHRILRQACTRLAAWSSHPQLGRLSIAVNISARQLHDDGFVDDLCRILDPNDAAIVRTIVALGQTLGLAVIAEGVETPAQRDMLLTSGCSLFQGYLFSYPVPAAEFESRLEQTP